MKTMIICATMLATVLSCGPESKADVFDIKVSAFEEVNLKVPAEVTWEDDDNSPACIIECSAENGQKLEAFVEGRTLVIKSKNKNWSDWGDKSGRILIRLKSSMLSKVSINGSGNFTMKNRNDSPDFEYTINGSGDLRAMVDAGSCKGTINGSGDVTIGGKSASFDCSINGSGDVKAFNLQAQAVDIHIAGSGDAEVHATESLNVKIAGSGDVKYKGDPKKLNQKVAGSGELKKV